MRTFVLLVLLAPLMLVGCVESATKTWTSDADWNACSKSDVSVDDDSVTLESSSSWDILNDDCDDITIWVDEDVVYGTSLESPEGQFFFQSGVGSGSKAIRSKAIETTGLTEYRVKIKVYHDYTETSKLFYLNTGNDTVTFRVLFRGTADSKLSFVGPEGTWIPNSDCPVYQDTWQIWEFVVTGAGDEDTQRVDIYLDGTLVSEDNNYGNNGAFYEDEIIIGQTGLPTSPEGQTHVDYIRYSSHLFAASGNLESPTFDTAQTTNWGAYSWNWNSTQTLTCKVETKETDAGWDLDNASVVTNGQDISSLASVTDGHRYFRFKYFFSTADTSETPQLDDATLNYSISKKRRKSSFWNPSSGMFWGK